MEKISTLQLGALFHSRLASRRHWLKGLGALMGTSLLASPLTLLANPASAAGSPAPTGSLNEEAFLGNVRVLAGPVLPQGWVLCDGRELSTLQYPALFAVLGTCYGGNGFTTFALPDVREALAVLLQSGSQIAIQVRPDAAVAAGPALRLRHHHLRRSARRA